MNTAFSPFRISLLLHFHTDPDPHPAASPDHDHRPAYVEAVTDFRNLGVIAPHDDLPGRIITTPLGQAWVKALCNVPVPTTAFVDEAGRIIKLP